MHEVRLDEAQSRSSACTHAAQARVVSYRERVCPACLALKDTWVHLRICMTCGHVGCCDNSKNRHATAHFKASGHPIMKSIEPGENWAWCYVDEAYLE